MFQNKQNPSSECLKVTCIVQEREHNLTDSEFLFKGILKFPNIVENKLK